MFIFEGTIKQYHAAADMIASISTYPGLSAFTKGDEEEALATGREFDTNESVESEP
jgi:hypothetical protein